MSPLVRPRVTITESGRDGTVVYADRDGSLSFHWEFGGGDCIAILPVGTADEWRTRHPWAAPRRDEILRFVGDEVVRRKAPTCVARVDEEQGVILLRPASAPAPSRATAISAPPRARAAATGSELHRRWTRVRERTVFIVLAVGLGLAAVTWVGRKVFAVDEGTGAPFGLSVRTDRHVATLIQTREPYTPSLHRDPSQDRYRVGVMLVPLDGSESRHVTVSSGLTSGSFSLAKVLGSDGAVLWYDVCGVGGIDLTRYERIAPDRSLLPDPAKLHGAPTTPLPLPLDAHLCTGLFVDAGTWLGLHSEEELARDCTPGRWLRPGVRAEPGRVARQLYRGTVEATAEGARPEPYRSIVAMSRLTDVVHVGAAFLRLDGRSEPLFLEGPPSALMVSSSGGDASATLRFARVSAEGELLWQVDTGLDRHSLRQLLPGTESTAFVGTRPHVPNQVPEPLLVIVDHTTGRQVQRSLRR